MVATRRAAQPAVEDELAMDDPELALKKKPVRKTTAKTTKTTAKSDAKPKTTRGRKVEPELEVQQDEQEEVEPAKPTRRAAGRPRKEAAPEPVAEQTCEPAKPTRATKAGSVRGRKAVAAAEEPENVIAIEPPKPTRATKAGSVRGRKAAVAVDSEPAPPAAEAKPTRSNKAGSVRGKKAAAAIEEPPVLPPPEESKPTRSTRTTALKAPPLSPKKITQVSKPATRTTRNASQKPAAKAAPVKAAPKGRAATRKRTESNENADPDADDDVEMVSGTPVKTRTTRGQAKIAETTVESETSMSSRPTTPTKSLTEAFNQNDEDIDELQRDIDSASEEQPVDDEVSDASDDELCGPKTPMKRASPGAAARYQESVQRTIRKYEETMNLETPARRFTVLGSQRGTPQTQKPYCKPAPPSSIARPMTVSRGVDRAFVFRDIRDGAPGIAQDESMEEDQDDLSFIPDENIIQLDDDEAAEPTPTPADCAQSAFSMESDAEMEDDVEQAPSMVAQDDEDAYIAPSLVEPDPEETMIIHDLGRRSETPEVDPVESFETEDTVLIHRPDDQEDDEQMSDAEESETEDGSVIHYETNSSKQSISNGTPIALNFESHLAEARLSPQKPQTENLDTPVDAMPVLELEEEGAVAGAEMDVDLDKVVPELPSRRQTVNLNEFIDFAALSEPTVNLGDIPVEPDTSLASVMEIDDSPEEVVSFQAETEAPKPEDLESHLPQPVEAKADVAEPVLLDNRDEHTVPHYALPTVSFDARRKSLPVLSLRTPIKTGARPNTSDGASMPRIANPFANAWWNRQAVGSTAATPVKSRPSTAHGVVSKGYIGTPAKVSAGTTPVATPGERFPRFAPRSNYEEHSKTAAPPARFQTPTKQSPKRRQTFHKAIPGQINSKPEAAASSPPRSPVATTQVTPGERYPRLRSRQDYEGHAKTVAAPVRFKTPPAKSPLKRPATTQKPESLRKAALKATASHTPMKAPLKGPAMTPSQAPMTPHPAAPLRGVVAMVEVYTLEGASASAPFVALLHRLGAKTTRAWSDRVTHVVFKDGSPTTLQRVRLNNKEADETGKGAYIHCVNSRWVTDCDTEGAHQDESDEAYVVDVAEVPRGGKRRRKSMEPSALMNIGGNIIGGRKSSLGRASIGRVSSLGRSPAKFDSPAKQPNAATIETPKFDVAEKENSGDDQSSPATPAWIAAPGNLVQQTAPMNRVRKLELQGGKEPKNRRLTFWNGAA